MKGIHQEHDLAAYPERLDQRERVVDGMDHIDLVAVNRLEKKGYAVLGSEFRRATEGQISHLHGTLPGFPPAGGLPAKAADNDHAADFGSQSHMVPSLSSAPFLLGIVRSVQRIPVGVVRLAGGDAECLQTALPQGAENHFRSICVESARLSSTPS